MEGKEGRTGRIFPTYSDKTLIRGIDEEFNNPVRSNTIAIQLKLNGQAQRSIDIRDGGWLDGDGSHVHRGGLGLEVAVVLPIVPFAVQVIVFAVPLTL